MSSENVVPLFDRSSDEDAETPTLPEAIGDVLREERTEQERTLVDVAREAAVSVPYLSEVERGRKEVSSTVLVAIADALDLPLPVVLDRVADRLRVGVQCRASLHLLAA
ncbi:MAG: helix-turn-helix transcriptional regulator [Actinobacteria bacterium]|nr:helix-turn-helix transcriptional regulator [Actinomycetota bacterium]